MIAGTVFNQLVTTLKGAPDLDYFEQVYEGLRYNIEPDSMPCIMVEPARMNEIERDMGQIKKIWMYVDIVAVVHSPVDPAFAIVGKKDMQYYGVYDIENDIRAVLQSSNTLGGNCEDIRFDPTEIIPFRDEDGMTTRAIRIPIKLLYRQTDSV